MTYLAGFNLGKATLGFALLQKMDRAEWKIIRLESAAHDGDPLRLFREFYGRYQVKDCDALAVTGLYADELVNPAVVLSEDACQEAACEYLKEFQGPLNVVSVGARGYGILSRGLSAAANGAKRFNYNYLENDKCSSGTGENMVKIAGRFGMDIAAADRLALTATEGIPVTARCSVFAKSEMTHFANQGKPTAALFRGYFESVGRNVLGLLDRNRVPGPVYVIGGVTRNRSFMRAFEDALGEAPIIAPHALEFEALGAALSLMSGGAFAVKLPEDPDSLVRLARKRFVDQRAASRWKDRVHVMPDFVYRAEALARPVVLGMDIGSTGSKAVLTDLETGEAVYDVYDRTRGNPVDAARRLIRQLIDSGARDIRAVGLTGSGREAVGTFLRAVFPLEAVRVFVANEIVAHATAAIRCDEAKGKDLSIIEIGGQDAKYIHISGGKIVESDMNKACSAGTGSFLEEQAIFYGVDDIGEFARLASASENPPDLGQMCTVFVADAANEALKEGYSKSDIFGGFQYSIIHNYINRVMGQRTLAKTIFFQGKPASNASLAWTVAAVTGRDVIIPPNPGAMGAWGIGLCALTELPIQRLKASDALPLENVLQAEIARRSEFRCNDPKCQTLCPIERTTVRIGGEDTTVLSGGACPKYEISSAAAFKIEKGAPDLLTIREELLAEFTTPAESDTDKRVIGFPRAAMLEGMIPFWVTFLRELGLRVNVVKAAKDALAEGERLCYSYDSCGPIKLAHAVCAQGDGDIFFPKMTFLHYDGTKPGRTCSMEQGLPDMIAEALASQGRSAKIIRPVVSLEHGYDSPEFAQNLRSVARELRAKEHLVEAAARKAVAAQRSFERRYLKAGLDTMQYARERHIPLVLLCGQLHVLHEKGVNAGIPQLLRLNGAMAIPIDAYPVDSSPDMPSIYWADANRTCRAARDARQRGDVFPLLLNSFACGPASMVEGVFAEILDDYPHTVLETDGHGGSAGYVTRVQAFMHTVRQFVKEGTKNGINRAADRLGEDVPDVELRRDTRYVLFSISDKLMPIIAASYRSLGYDVVAAPPATARTLSLGKSDCSGKECLPYQIIWGSFRQYMEDNPPGKPTVLMQVGGESPCRNGMFRVKDRISLAKLDRPDMSIGRFKPFTSAFYATKLWAGFVAWDIIKAFYAYHAAIEDRPGAAHEAYERYSENIIRLIEKPVRHDLMDAVSMAADWTELKDLIRCAGREYVQMTRQNRNKADRVVLLSGDIYLRHDEFSNDGLIDRLAHEGLRVLTEPLCLTGEYLAEICSGDLFGMPTDFFGHLLYKNAIRFIRSALYEEARILHPWLPQPDVTAYLAESKPYLNGAPRGEAPITVGSVLHHHKVRACDGAVLVSPWGCGPALVAESILRHRREIPSLFIYSDGSPIDVRRVKSFAFRLKRAEPRTRHIAQEKETEPVLV